MLQNKNSFLVHCSWRQDPGITSQVIPQVAKIENTGLDFYLLRPLPTKLSLFPSPSPTHSCFFRFPPLLHSLEFLGSSSQMLQLKCGLLLWPPFAQPLPLTQLSMSRPHLLVLRVRLNSTQLSGGSGPEQETNFPTSKF